VDESLGVLQLNQAGALIVSDDAEFGRAVDARWRTIAQAPEITLATSDVWGQAIAERQDLVIVGPLAPEISEVLLEALAEQCASTVIFVSESDHQLADVAKRHPHFTTIALRGDWVERLTKSLAESLGRSESDGHAESTDHDVALENHRLAALGRYMLDVRPTWNNALTSVLGNADLLLLDPGSLQAGPRDQIEVIQSMALRLREIMRRFSLLDAEMRSGETASQAETHSPDRAFVPAR
jgi:hypothetical protein